MNVLNAATGLRLSRKPTDPLTTTQEYTYSKLAYGSAYQIKANWEGDKVTYETLLSVNQVQAATGNPTISYIKGNYNGVVAKTQTGNTIYILAVPSIVSGTGSMGLILKIETGDLSGSLVVNGGSNLGEVTFNPSAIYGS